MNLYALRRSTSVLLRIKCLAGWGAESGEFFHLHPSFCELLPWPSGAFCSAPDAFLRQVSRALPRSGELSPFLSLVNSNSGFARLAARRAKEPSSEERVPFCDSWIGAVAREDPGHLLAGTRQGVGSVAKSHRG